MKWVALACLSLRALRLVRSWRAPRGGGTGKQGQSGTVSQGPSGVLGGSLWVPEVSLVFPSGCWGSSCSLCFPRGSLGVPEGAHRKSRELLGEGPGGADNTEDFLRVSGGGPRGTLR